MCSGETGDVTTHRDAVAAAGLHRRGERDGAEDIGGEPQPSVLVLSGP